MKSKDDVQKQLFNYIDQWQQSDFSQKAFCKQVNLPYHIFHYWYKRYRNNANEPSSSFVKLNVSASSTVSHAELILVDGKRLLFHQPLSADYLKSIIS